MPTEDLGEDDFDKARSFWKQLLQGITSRTSLGINRILTSESIGSPQFRTQVATVGD